MKRLITPVVVNIVTATTLLFTPCSQGAISLDRTRIIMDGENKSVSLTITNENQRLPYLAQGWIENAQGEKISAPLTVLPPVQRIEAGEKSQVKIQALSSINLLAQNKETLFYFNLREIPPRSDKPNTLQIALQTKIKLFYRPAALQISPTEYSTPVQQQVTLVRTGDRYRIQNPTGYYLTFIEARRRQAEESAGGFVPLMVAPFDSAELGVSAAALGTNPVLEYVNDFGGRSPLTFHCQEMTCQVIGRR